MSWDVMIFNFGGVPPPLFENIQESDFRPLGAANDVRRRISEYLPGIDWSEPNWGIYATEDGVSIEFNIAEDDPITRIMLHVRGEGDPVTAILSFACPMGWAALDCSTSEFLDPQNPARSAWDQYRRYRGKLVNQSRPIPRKPPNREGVLLILILIVCGGMMVWLMRISGSNWGTIIFIMICFWGILISYWGILHFTSAVLSRSRERRK